MAKFDVNEIRNHGKERMTNLQQKLTENKSFVEKDERFWTLDYNKDTKVGRAIIRPIGPAPGEKDEFVTEYTHFIRRNNKVLSLNCPTTVGEQCPICQYYFSKDKSERDVQFSRATKFIMNILVVQDFQHPENNGKVFLYRCPVSIMNKIKDALQDVDEMSMPKEPINVFDMWEGANINIVTRDKGGWLNYDSTKISNKSPIFEDTENTALYQELYDKLYSLKEFKVAPSTQEVKEQFNEFMNNIDTSTNDIENHVRKEAAKGDVASISEIIDDSIPDFDEPVAKPDFIEEVAEEDLFGDL